MDETNHFKIWDWDTGDWINPDEMEEVLQVNYKVSGEVGEGWCELKNLPSRDLEMVFKDNDGNFKDPRGD